jgi:hypothetical protein
VGRTYIFDWPNFSVMWRKSQENGMLQFLSQFIKEEPYVKIIGGQFQ